MISASTPPFVNRTMHNKLRRTFPFPLFPSNNYEADSPKLNRNGRVRNCKLDLVRQRYRAGRNLTRVCRSVAVQMVQLFVVTSDCFILR